MADYASDSGHFYDAITGEPRYTVIGKNGKERATTIRDAREHGWVRSVTSVIAAANKPGLVSWMVDQGILAALTLPRIVGESNDDLLKRIRADAKEQARRAAEEGQNIHGAIERHLSRLPFDPKYQPHVKAAMAQLEHHCPDAQWESEKSFAHMDGYGGKVDLHSRIRTRRVVDFKGTDFKGKIPQLWEDHYMQTAAYRRGLGISDAICGIVFIARDQPGDAVYLECEEAGLQRGLAMFDALLAYVQARDGYDRAAMRYAA
jgi:hypothetical protein